MPDQSFNKTLPKIDPPELPESRILILDEHRSFLPKVIKVAAMGLKPLFFKDFSTLSASDRLYLELMM
jgi:hypothetical protein